MHDVGSGLGHSIKNGSWRNRNENSSILCDGLFYCCCFFNICNCVRRKEISMIMNACNSTCQVFDYNNRNGKQ